MAGNPRNSAGISCGGQHFRKIGTKIIPKNRISGIFTKSFREAERRVSDGLRGENGAATEFAESAGRATPRLCDLRQQKAVKYSIGE